ncbi:MAG: helix-turn-helix domain-containing protein [Bacteroidales bacterium]
MDNLEDVSSELLIRYYQLLQTAVKSSDLNHLADCASKILNNPFIFLDTSYNVVGFTKNRNINDRLWNESIKLGYLCDDITKEVIEKYRAYYMSISSNEPFEAILETSKYKWIVSNAYFNRHLCGTINMLCINDFPLNNEADVNTIKMISDIFARLMVNDESIIDRVQYEDVFKDLINGNINNKVLLKNRLVNTELEHIKSFFLINVYFETFVHSTVLTFKNKLKSIAYNGWIFYHENFLLILIEKNSNLDKQKKIFSEIEKLINTFSLKGCISDCFDDLSLLFDYYQKNKRAIIYSYQFPVNENLITYSKFRFYDIVNTALKSMPNKDINQLVDQRIIEIKKYDRTNGTDYFKTLLLYLRSNKSCKLTAEKLFCHKNTIDYRISRLKELYDIDLEDSETYFNLYYSCEILEAYDK